MKELNGIVEIFLEESANVSYDAIVCAFGTPAHMAQEMMSRDVSDGDIQREKNRRKRLRHVQNLALIMVCVCACAAAVFFYWQRENNPHQIATVVYEDESQIPSITKNGLKYGLSYQLDKEDNIIAAFDKAGNAVDVDADGIPRGEKKN